MIVTCTNAEKDSWVQHLGDKHEKYRVTKSFIHDSVKYCTGDILDKIPEGFNYEKNLKLKSPNLKL
jgi:hypothetical protein